jgi:hypothetical protein
MVAGKVANLVFQLVEMKDLVMGYRLAGNLVD